MNIVPKAILRHSNAGSMTFTVDEIDQLTPFFKLINYQTGLDSEKKIAALTQSSLEKLQRQPSQGAPRPRKTSMDELHPDLRNLITSGLVKDCGISNTSLEEVFLKVTKKEE